MEKTKNLAKIIFIGIIDNKTILAFSQLIKKNLSDANNI